MTNLVSCRSTPEDWSYSLGSHIRGAASTTRLPGLRNRSEAEALATDFFPEFTKASADAYAQSLSSVLLVITNVDESTLANHTTEPTQYRGYLVSVVPTSSSTRESEPGVIRCVVRVDAHFQYIELSDQIDSSWVGQRSMGYDASYIYGSIKPSLGAFLEAGGREVWYEYAAVQVNLDIREAGVWDLDSEERELLVGADAWSDQRLADKLGTVNMTDIVSTAHDVYREVMLDRMRSRNREERRRADRERRQGLERSQRRLEQFFAKMQENLDPELQVIPGLPFVPHGLASSRRWGIEIESGGARGIEAPDGWDRKGDGSLRSAWDGYTEVQDFEPYDEVVEHIRSWSACELSDNHNPVVMAEVAGRGWVPTLNPNFQPVEQCSQCGPVSETVRVEPQTIRHSARGDDCAEFVSPILTSMHSKGLEFILTEVSKQPQNDTAGVHVHVEADDLSPREVQTLVYAYGVIEPIIQASYRRNRRDYCRSTPIDEMLLFAREAKDLALDRGMPYGERYRSVNLNALDAHGTIEFRAMGPVYDYDHLVRWAMFCREMVNIVKAGATVTEFGRIAGSWDGLLKMFLKYGKEYTRAVVHEKTGETGEWAKLDKAGASTGGELANAIQADFEAWMQTLTGNVSITAELAQPLDTYQVSV